jgi:hypothetical protein
MFRERIRDKGKIYGWDVQSGRETRLDVVFMKVLL